MHLTALALPLLAAATVAPPKLAAGPSLTVRATPQSVSIGAVVRLDRPFADRAEQRRYALVAAPRLHTGQRLPDRLFGGTSLGRLRNRPGAWYAAEAIQITPRSRVARGARWQVALVRGNHVVGGVRTVRLKRG